ncbi:MAG: DUF1904 domain-containing protein [Negativicutes bacterium]|nr:DUF1904 domain-containing protein [Negativicutes bacterium]
MPQIIFRGVERADIAAFQWDLLERLSEAAGCPRDHFVVEHRAADFLCDHGRHCSCGPLIQVYWFERGKEVRDKVAGAIDRAVRGRGYKTCEIYFIPLQPENYYENGVCLGGQPAGGLE